MKYALPIIAIILLSSCDTKEDCSINDEPLRDNAIQIESTEGNTITSTHSRFIHTFNITPIHETRPPKGDNCLNKLYFAEADPHTIIGSTVTLTCNRDLYVYDSVYTFTIGKGSNILKVERIKRNIDKSQSLGFTSYKVYIDIIDSIKGTYTYYTTGTDEIGGIFSDSITVTYQ